MGAGASLTAETNDAFVRTTLADFDDAVVDEVCGKAGGLDVGTLAAAEERLRILGARLALGDDDDARDAHHRDVHAATAALAAAIDVKVREAGAARHAKALDAVLQQPLEVPRHRVIVVGAGVSGLACANALLRSTAASDRNGGGMRVTVLEGRKRIGGRTHTQEDGLDLGAHWIHGGDADNPVRALCEHHGIPTTDTWGDSTYIGEGGDHSIHFYITDDDAEDATPRAMTEAETETLWDIYDEIYAAVHALEASLRAKGAEGVAEGRAMSLQDAFDRVIAARSPPLTPFEAKLVNWHVESEFGGDWGADPSDLSFFHFDGGGAAGSYQSFHGGDRVLRGPKGGYSDLIDNLAAPVLAAAAANDSSAGGGVVLDDPVVAIAHGAVAGDNAEPPRPWVKVTTASGVVHEGDACVVTLPLGVLQRQQGQAGHVVFDPPLPAWKRDAIGRLNMGLLNKLFLLFDKPQPLIPRKYSFAFVNAVPNKEPSMIVNMQVSHDIPGVCVLVGGAAGEAMERRSEADNAAWAMRLLHKLWSGPGSDPGARLDAPAKVVMTRWRADPFAYGAYWGMGVRAEATARQDSAEHFFRSNTLHCTARTCILIPAQCSAIS